MFKTVPEDYRARTFIMGSVGSHWKAKAVFALPYESRQRRDMLTHKLTSSIRALTAEKRIQMVAAVCAVKTSGRYVRHRAMVSGIWEVKGKGSVENR